MPVEGMEADIYPRQCVTGSAKSAMMNVLAGINPQCTPPLPSSSAVPPPPVPLSALLLLPRCFPSHHLSHPLTARPRTLSKHISFLLSFLHRSPPPAPFLLAFPLQPFSVLPSLLLLLLFAVFFCLLYPRTQPRLYIELARQCSFFAMHPRRVSMPRIYFLDARHALPRDRREDSPVRGVRIVSLCSIKERSPELIPAGVSYGEIYRWKGWSETE